MRGEDVVLYLLFSCVSSIAKYESCYQHVREYSLEYITSLYLPVCQLSEGEHLIGDFKNWYFSAVQLNLIHLPVEQNRQNYVREVRNSLFSHVVPTPFRSRVKLSAVWDHVLSDLLDLHPGVAHSQDFIQFVSGSRVLGGSSPLSHRYGGHQFGVWADQLGDGRAHLLGEYVNHMHQRWELQLKGSGKTPYSRRGDGRAVIRSSVREFLASEAMFFLGVPTSRAASLAVSYDTVTRDQFNNGDLQKERTAVVLRLAPSWIRFGSFEILAIKGELDILRKLKDFVIQQYFPDINLHDPNHLLDFFDTIVTDTASLIAQWQSVGFTHGVMNTDNFSILSITIDYGPFRFMDDYNPEIVPNTSDDEHRYGYEKQPDVAWFNLDKLRLALEHLATSKQREQLKFILREYSERYKNMFMKIFREKIGIEGYDKRDEYLIGMLLKMMGDARSDFTMTFRQLSDWTTKDISKSQVPQSLWAIHNFSSHEHFNEFCDLYLNRIRSSPMAPSRRSRLMNRRNPRYILRNWMAQEAIIKAEKDDFSGLHFIQRVLERPYTYQKDAELAGYSDPPPTWAAAIKVSCSS